MTKKVEDIKVFALNPEKAAEIIESLREKYSEDRYRVSPILKEKAIKGEKFF